MSGALAFDPPHLNAAALDLYKAALQARIALHFVMVSECAANDGKPLDTTREAHEAISAALSKADAQ
jgi:hypothetical protein